MSHTMGHHAGQLYVGAGQGLLLLGVLASDEQLHFAPLALCIYPPPPSSLGKNRQFNGKTIFLSY